MSRACPVSLVAIDKRIVRLNAILSALTILLFLLTQSSLFSFVLLFDFSARVTRQNALSPFWRLSSLCLSLSRSDPIRCDEAPKRFALFLGWILAASLFAFFFVGLQKVTISIAILLFVCTLLEALFDFCIGCWLYYLIKRFS